MTEFAQWFGNSATDTRLIVAIGTFAGLAVWVVYQNLGSVRRLFSGSRHTHATQMIDTGHGQVRLELDESGWTSRFRLYSISGSNWRAEDVLIEMSGPDGSHQVFGFRARADFLEAREPIAEPHEFRARLILGHAGHTHSFPVAFAQEAPGHTGVVSRSDTPLSMN